jgi:hypothetical protein
MIRVLLGSQDNWASESLFADELANFVASVSGEKRVDISAFDANSADNVVDAFVLGLSKSLDKDVIAQKIASFIAFSDEVLVRSPMVLMINVTATHEGEGVATRRVPAPDALFRSQGH